MPENTDALTSPRGVMRHVLFPMVLVLRLAAPALAEEATNNCQDPAAWADWEEKAAQYPFDTEVQKLHGLWKRLCEKVETGELSFEDALYIFEQAREQAIEQRRKEQQVPPSSTLPGRLREFFPPYLCGAQE